MDCETNMEIVGKGDTVQLSFEGKLENGQKFFDNKDGKPNIVIGENQIFPALEKELIGMKNGESKTVSLEAKEAYGDHNEELLLSISKEKIPQDVDTTIGETLEMDIPDGNKIRGVITDISDDIITVDFNHPFAGKNVIITCTVISIKKQNE